MRVVHISNSNNENGAHLAGFRLHKGLLQLGVDSTMFVRRLDDSGDAKIRVYQQPKGIFLRVRRGAYRYWLARDMARYKWRLDGFPVISDRAADGLRPIAQIPPADVIYIHDGHDFIDYPHVLPVLAERAHIVFVLHDMSFFTGGCTYARDCTRFTDRCGACPILLSHNENDPTRRIWERKTVLLSRMHGRLHFVSPSRWIAGDAKRSSLLRNWAVEIIPNGVDTEVFRPHDRSGMRELLGIPQDLPVVGFLSQPLARAEKGFAFLAKAIEAMEQAHRPFLVTVGGGKPPVHVATPHKHFGRVYDSHLLCALYCAADVLAIPSLEDNLPNVVLEAMACGTPVVASSTGGIPEMVRHKETGLLVSKCDVGALREGIGALLQDSAARARMAENGRKVAVEEYSLSVQAKRHAEFCSRITHLPSGAPNLRPVQESIRCQ